MKYFVKSGGKIYGPVDENKIANKIAGGFFAQDCLISVDKEEWVPQPFVKDDYDDGAAVAIPLAEPSAEPPRKDEGAGAERPTIRVVRPGVVKLGAANIVSPAERASKRAGGFPWAVVIVIVAGVAAAVAICIAAKIFFFDRQMPPWRSNQSEASRRDRRSAATSAPPAVAGFEEVCANYRSAVGVVVVTLEDSDGKLLTNIGELPIDCYQRIGTAFAIGDNKFATNCHVAYALKDQKNALMEEILKQFYIAEAKKHGVRSHEEFVAFLKKNRATIDSDRKFLQEHVRVRNVEIRLAHSDGMTLPVSGVQVHPRYKANSRSREEEYRNAEFDVAIISTSKRAPVYFRRGDTGTLYKLAQGQKIAYLGFPMEGLTNAGGLNLEKPEATFKSGTINKITDFNNVYSEPKNNRSITHDIPIVGGVSGSPVFLENGEVIAVAWGGSHDFDEKTGKRTASAALHNFAVRIDSLDAVEEASEHDIKEWLGEKK